MFVVSSSSPIVSIIHRSALTTASLFSNETAYKNLNTAFINYVDQLVIQKDLSFSKKTNWIDQKGPRLLLFWTRNGFTEPCLANRQS
ncbi:hypothetical protein RRG08_020145 [Elysia crispata]|uniref:Uncharacterized protein n=1 Tax=Elysia crispata TaxID=231223 RepID=A0AAE1B1A6_9GAST|nr:hypothetical protein RRG08_020145 [Elysia crispata]